MHVLVIEENKAEREAIAGLLRQATHRVDVAADAMGAAAFLQNTSPEVVLLDWTSAAPEIVRRLRSCESEGHAYVIALLDKHPPAAIPAILQAGADDFLRRPLAREEVVARAEAPSRIARWAASSKALAARDLTAEFDLRNLNAFKNMGSVVLEDLKGILGDLDVAEGWLIGGELRGASIPMAVASEQAEIRVSIVVEAKLLRTLAGLLLGDEGAPPPAIEDMLREIANTAGGAVKRAAADEGVTVTTGLPINEARGLTRNELTRCWTARLNGEKAQFGIIGEVHRRKNERLPVSKLQEGMVLSHDLRNGSGALIMPAGTRLTATTVTRMAGLLGSRFVVEITAP